MLKQTDDGQVVWGCVATFLQLSLIHNLNSSIFRVLNIHQHSPRGVAKFSLKFRENFFNPFLISAELWPSFVDVSNFAELRFAISTLTFIQLSWRTIQQRADGTKSFLFWVTGGEKAFCRAFLIRGEMLETRKSLEALRYMKNPYTADCSWWKKRENLEIIQKNAKRKLPQCCSIYRFRNFPFSSLTTSSTCDIIQVISHGM